ncbi:hypothetical protein CCP2SC5_70076 [Azospirillaceae bacterium]
MRSYSRSSRPRDSRVVERKKYGRAKARRSFQFSALTFPLLSVPKAASITAFGIGTFSTLSGIIAMPTSTTKIRIAILSQQLHRCGIGADAGRHPPPNCGHSPLNGKPEARRRYVPIWPYNLPNAKS